MQKVCLLKKGLSKNVYRKVQDMYWKIYCYLPCFISLIFISFYSTANFFFHFFAAVTQAPKPKPGTCPFYPIRIRCAVTTSACLTDNECPGNLKCCYDNCRSICTLPDYGMNKNIHSLSLLR